MSLSVRSRATRPSTHDRWREAKGKAVEKMRSGNVPFDVRPGSEMTFELGQVSHGDLLFVRKVEVERSKFDVRFVVRTQA
jgi:hypothetical protein